MSKEIIPAFLNTFAKRQPFIDVYFHFHNKHFFNRPEFPFYLAIDNKDYFLEQEGLNILTYEDTPTSSEELHECVSRYWRHVYTLNYFKSLGHKYVMNCMDDGWISLIDWDRLYMATQYIEDHNADRIDICGPQILYNCIPIDENVSLVDPNNDITWYVTNQCSIWKVDSLLSIYDTLGPVTDWEVEKIGSDVARQLKCKFLTFNSPVMDNIGINQRKVGFSEKGRNLLQEYCTDKNLDFNTELEKFKQFI